MTIPPRFAEGDFSALLRRLPTSCQERVLSHCPHPDAVSSLLGWLLACSEICRATGLCGEDLTFSTDCNGKPCLAGHPDAHFNISHAGSYVACAVSDRAVGIDIEVYRTVRHKIAEHYFAPDEIQYVSGDAGVSRFFEIWTKKESNIKWDGRGLSKPLPSFSVLEPPIHGAPNYHEVYSDGQAVCHVCTSSIEKPAVRAVSGTDLPAGLLFNLPIHISQDP